MCARDFPKSQMQIPQNASPRKKLVNVAGKNTQIDNTRKTNVSYTNLAINKLRLPHIIRTAHIPPGRTLSCRDTIRELSRHTRSETRSESMSRHTRSETRSESMSRHTQGARHDQRVVSAHTEHGRPTPDGSEAAAAAAAAAAGFRAGSGRCCCTRRCRQRSSSSSAAASSARAWRCSR